MIVYVITFEKQYIKFAQKYKAVDFYICGFNTGEPE